jgi:3-phenylpropionate/trans-cinnamate dioxygenase ferredoxin subunit
LRAKRGNPVFDLVLFMTIEFIEAAKLSDIAESGIYKLKLKGEPLILTRVNGEVFCVIDRCSHEDVPLSLGCIKGDRIKCSYHGSHFSLRTGEPTDEPADSPIRVYPVKVEKDKVFIQFDSEK